MRKSSPELALVDTSKLAIEIDRLQPPARSLREVISDLGEAIRRAVARGVTFDEISAHLSRRGVTINAITLQRYVRGEPGKRPPTLSTARAAVAATQELATGIERKPRK